MSPYAIPAIVVCLAALAVEVRVLVATRRGEPRRVRCEAFDGPCDGHTWTLPGPDPIWLLRGDRHHLYRAAGITRGGNARYIYTGRSAPSHLALGVRIVRERR